MRQAALLMLVRSDTPKHALLLRRACPVSATMDDAALGTTSTPIESPALRCAGEIDRSNQLIASTEV